jgi:hypothetical protein
MQRIIIAGDNSLSRSLSLIQWYRVARSTILDSIKVRLTRGQKLLQRG